MPKIHIQHATTRGTFWVPDLTAMTGMGEVEWVGGDGNDTSGGEVEWVGGAGNDTSGGARA